jgi:N6-L-threonylcarbamoyladenine synthase
MIKDKYIMAIESSCDETSIAIIKNNKIFSNIVSSQIAIHKDLGGVVPELASRLHLENIDIVCQEALDEANLKLSDIDFIGVVNGPGLVGALHVGIVFAKGLSYINKIPLIYLNHMAGHIYANGLIDDLEFPLLALVVSGGHTELVYMKEHLSFEIISHTLDDAVGECYDKIARLLQLGYPGGPIIDKLAKKGKCIYDFPIPHPQNEFAFSYSGLKSAVINKLNQMKMKKESFNKEDIACSFQEAAIAQLLDRIKKALDIYPVRHFVLAGGVSANSYLRDEVKALVEKSYSNVKMTLPPLWCCTDNAAMIASLAQYYDETDYGFDYTYSVEPNKILKK